MQKLNDNELLAVNGGIAKTVIGGIFMGVVFIASVIYGYINPNKCN